MSETEKAQEQIKQIEIFKVQNGTLRIDNDFIKLANVTSIEDYTERLGWKRAENSEAKKKGWLYFTYFLWLLFLGGMTIITFLIYNDPSTEWTPKHTDELVGISLAGVLIIGTATFLLYAMSSFLNPRTPIYQYSIVISSIGKIPMRLILGKDVEFAQKIADKLRDEVEKDVSTASYVFNVDQRTIEDNSQVINNHNIRYEIDMSQHHGMSQQDMEFFSGEFARAVNELSTHITETNNAELTAKLDELVQEVKSQKPNKNKVLASYDKLKEMSEGYDVLERVASFAGIVGMAIMKI